MRWSGYRAGSPCASSCNWWQEEHGDFLSPEDVQQGGKQLTPEDAAVLAVALPGLQELQLVNPSQSSPLASPEALAPLRSLAPSLVVCAVHSV